MRPGREHPDAVAVGVEAEERVAEIHPGRRVIPVGPSAPRSTAKGRSTQSTRGRPARRPWAQFRRAVEVDMPPGAGTMSGGSGRGEEDGNVADRSELS